MILNVAFYRFVELDRPDSLRVGVRALCARLGLKGTVILSPEGINGFLAGPEEPLRTFLKEVSGLHPALVALITKDSWSESVPFLRMKVKLKREIIPMGKPDIKPSRRTGKRLSPAELKRWLDEGRELLLLDTRNRYEVERGTFEGAKDLGLRAFREFGDALARLPGSERKRPVVMFCTGGIRCEKATALALQESGFEDVWQLEGGILKYFEDCGRSHYQGECFVFDEREALTPDLRPSD